MLSIGVLFEVVMLLLSTITFFLLEKKVRYFLVYVAALMLLPEIWGQNTGIASYDQSFFSPLYIAGTPLILPFAWFALIGLSITLSKNILVRLTGSRFRYLTSFAAGALMSLLLELPMTYYSAWSNNFGNLHIVPGYPYILPFLYGLYVSWFVFLYDRLASRIEAQRTIFAGLIFTVIYIPTMLLISGLIVISIPL